MKLCLRCNQYFDDPADKCPNDGALLENVGKDPLIGALINNRYLVDSVIGKGSSGIVYKARRLGRGEMVVAIKVLHSYIGVAGSSLDRFLREAQAASRLRNPHIITIWESGVTEDGQPYFVMDYLEGTTLGYLIKEKGNLEPMRVLSLLHQICDALAEAHKQGIVHRDLKPENVVLQESAHGHDYVKLLDFGIADSPQHAQSSFKLEKPRTVSGSPAYMSPEQCQGLELDARSDIYSLGIVVFEMLTGKRPFVQNDNVNVMVLHVNEPPMTLNAVRPDLVFPKKVEDVIARALSKRPHQRQATVQEFLLEFELAWQDLDNPIGVVHKIEQPQPTNEHHSSHTHICDQVEHATAITSDELGVQAGDDSVAAWGNVSIQPSSKTLVAEQDKSNEVLWQANFEPASDEKALAEMWAQQEKIKTVNENVLDQATAMPAKREPNKECESAARQETSKTSELPIDKKQLVDNKSELSITGKNRTIERLMAAAKRGQSGPHPVALSENKSPSADAIVKKLVEQDNASEKMPQSTSGWYPVHEMKSDLTSAIHANAMPPTGLPAPGLSSNQSSTPGTIVTRESSSTLPYLSGPGQTSIPSFSAMPAPPSTVSSLATPASASSSGSSLASTFTPTGRSSGQPSKQGLTPGVTSSLTGFSPATSNQNIESASNELSDQSQPEDQLLSEPNAYIKQRYRNTISRLQGIQRVNKVDSTLVTTRARAAALKADSTQRPMNFWHLAIAVVTLVCLAAAAYVIYSALTMPLSPITSIETMLRSGNYQRVIDILEGKSLSTALSSKEKDELSFAYLVLAKSSLSKNKLDQALSFLGKIDPLSPSAFEGNQIKTKILQTRRSTAKK